MPDLTPEELALRDAEQLIALARLRRSVDGHPVDVEDIIASRRLRRREDHERALLLEPTDARHVPHFADDLRRLYRKMDTA